MAQRLIVSLTTALVVAASIVLFLPGVVAAAPPTVDFTGSSAGETPPAPSVAPFTVSFVAMLSSDPATELTWDFGDGETLTCDPSAPDPTGSECQMPDHTYTAEGSFTVSLTARNADGSTTESKTDYVIARSPVVVEIAETGRSTSVDEWGRTTVIVEFGSTVTGGTEPYNYEWVPSRPDLFAGGDQPSYSINYTCTLSTTGETVEFGNAFDFAVQLFISDSAGQNADAVLEPVVVECPATPVLPAQTTIAATDCNPDTQTSIYTYTVDLPYPDVPGGYVFAEARESSLDPDIGLTTQPSTAVTVEQTGPAAFTAVETRTAGSQPPRTHLYFGLADPSAPEDAVTVYGSGVATLTSPVACGALSTGAPGPSPSPTPSPEPATTSATPRPAQPLMLPDTAMASESDAGPFGFLGGLVGIAVLATIGYAVLSGGSSSSHTAKLADTPKVTKHDTLLVALLAAKAAGHRYVRAPYQDATIDEAIALAEGGPLGDYTLTLTPDEGEVTQMQSFGEIPLLRTMRSLKEVGR